MHRPEKGRVIEPIPSIPIDWHPPAKIEEVQFSATVSPQRAEYLTQCLDEPLCTGCGREEAECSADPCPGVIADRGEPASQDDAEIERNKRILELAADQHQKDGEVEIEYAEDLDIYTLMSEGEDNGTYVKAWVWVDFAGTDLDKEAEECAAR